MRNSLHYHLLFRPEPDGGFTVIAPSLPGCISYGKTLQEAKQMALDAIIGYIASLKKHKDHIPSDNESFLASVELTEERNRITGMYA